MLFAVLALLAAPAGQDAEPAAGGTPPQRIINLIVYGDDPCPSGGPDDIVVCSREDRDEQYRIPKQFRERPVEPPSASWTRRAELIEEVNRVGRPGSCSPVGTGGQTGCNSALLRLWRDDRDAKRVEAGRLESTLRRDDAEDDDNDDDTDD